jgi:hypothetical protein
LFHADLLALGHHRLWVGGVQHNDISVRNLMYDKLNQDCGILNDYDLAHLDGSARPSGTERTGTIPFMALDLLTHDAWNGNIIRQYRHDWESFAWVLLWICCRFASGTEISNPPLNDFITNDYAQCFLVKNSIFTQLWKINPTPSYQQFWHTAMDFVGWSIDKRHMMDRQGPGVPLEEPTVEQLLEIYRSILDKNGFQMVL